jgi:predicted CoA-binding protein
MKVYWPDGAVPANDPVADILRETKTIAVVGLSSNRARPSYGVSAYMQAAGFRIIPVNPHETEVLGQKSYARLEDVPGKVDMVNIFRRAEFLGPVVTAAIAIGAKSVWMQLGIANSAAAEMARAAGLKVVENACVLVEHGKRL